MEFLAQEGNPLDEFVRQAETMQVGLAIIGRRVDTNQHHIDAKNIIWQINSDVLVIPETSKPVLKNILVAFDFSENAARALETAVAIQKQMTTPVTITAINIFNQPDFATFNISIDVDAYEKNMMENRKNALKKLLADYALDSTKPIKSMVIRKGEDNIADLLLKQAKELGTDLIIMGGKGHSKMELLLMSFDLLHVVPPQSAPDFIKNGVLATDKGWVEVDINSLQHKRFPNVFALGDVADLPTGKTGAAVRKQAPVIVRNICNLIDGKGIDEKLQYDGYSACPILTDYSHVVMAEFTYDYTPSPSVKFIDTTKPSYLMYLAKHYYLPWFYWNRMLKGKG